VGDGSEVVMISESEGEGGGRSEIIGTTDDYCYRLIRSADSTFFVRR
jgi:hypothetical protein